MLHKEFTECPHCHSTETLVRKAYDETGQKAPAGHHVSMQNRQVVLSNPAIMALSVEVLTLYYDVCAGCGMTRVVEAEVKKQPVGVSRKALEHS